MSFWSERARLHGIDPRANTNDVWLREVEIAYVDKTIRENSFRRIMDFGCANGFSTARLARSNQTSQFLGIDINSDMISAAKGQLEQESVANLEFKQIDVLREPIRDRFDFIYGIRVFQKIESQDMQKKDFRQAIRTA